MHSYSGERSLINFSTNCRIFFRLAYFKWWTMIIQYEYSSHTVHRHWNPNKQLNVYKYVFISV